MKSRFYRPDWSKSPDCPGDKNCDGKTQCPVFGIPGFCEWPCAIPMDNYDTPYWYPAKDAGLAEKWLKEES